MPAPSPINIKDSPKNRQVMERAIKDIAKVFGKEDEFNARKKASDKMQAARDIRIKMLNAGGDSTPTPKYTAIQDEYHKTMTAWLHFVGLTFARLYALGFEDGYSDCERASK
jgi:hypothetical protein